MEPLEAECQVGGSPAYLQHVHLNSTHHADHLTVPPAHLPRLEGGISDVGAETSHSAQEREAVHLERARGQPVSSELGHMDRD